MFVGDDDSVQIVRLLDQTVTSIDGVSVREATEALDLLSTKLPHFPYRLLSIASGKLFCFVWVVFSFLPDLLINSLYSEALTSGEEMRF